MRFSDDLLAAITHNQVEPFKDLLAKAPLDTRQTDEHGRLLLHWAAQEDAFDIVEWLAGETPELINQPDHDGQSPLRIAAGEGHVVTVGVLLEKGAAVYPPGQPEHESAMTVARLYGHEIIVEMLEFAADRPGLMEEMRKRFSQSSRGSSGR